MIKSATRRHQLAQWIQTALTAALLLLAWQSNATAQRPARYGEFFTGLLLGCAILLAGPLGQFLAARVVGARMLRLRIGHGPVLRHFVWHGCVVTLRVLPLHVSGAFLPRPERLKRDHALITAAGPAGNVAIAAVLAPFLPGYAGLCMGVVVVANGLSRWVRTEPALTAPQSILFRDTISSLLAGEIQDAEQALPRLREYTDNPLLAALVEMYLAIVRADYGSALAIVRAVPAEQWSRVAADYHQLLLVEAEAERGKVPQAVEEVGRALAGVTKAAEQPELRAVLAHYRIETGRPQDAVASAQWYYRDADTPFVIADALCTRARVEAALGQLERASRTLRQAQAIAPWYTRIGIVRGLVLAEWAAPRK